MEIWQFQENVIFFGQGGMTASNVSERLLIDLKLYTPDIVFLHFGGNDIRENSSCKAVCENIKFIVDELYRAGNKVVFVAEICERGNFTKAPGLTYDIFKKQKNTVNRSLQKLFGDKFVKFKDISFPNDYDKDLVHFSDSGMKKYFYRIRRTFLSSRCMSDK